MHIRPNLPICRAYATLAFGVMLIFQSPAPVHGQNRLSDFTNREFIPDGDIGEFINDDGNSQEYFEVLSGGNPEFGKIIPSASLARGVFVFRDQSPVLPDPFDAGPTGFGDLPGGQGSLPVPTGFNIGRLFASYNATLDAYFIALDISGPAILDQLWGTQPVSFDVDGNGDPSIVSELLVSCPTLSDVPTFGNDFYRLRFDLDQDGVDDISIDVVESTIPSSSEASLDLPSSNPAVYRYIQIASLDGSVVDPAAFMNMHFDSDGDGLADAGVVGIGDDVEIMITNVTSGSDPDDPFLTRNVNPACARITVTVDNPDDLCLGGDEDSITMPLGFPVASTEVTLLARMPNAGGSYSDVLQVPLSSTVELVNLVSVSGNRSRSFVTLVTQFDCSIPATATLVAGSCRVKPIDFEPLVCDRLESSWADGFAVIDLDEILGSTTAQCVVDVDTLEIRYEVSLGTLIDTDLLCERFFECAGRSILVNEEVIVDPLPDTEEAGSGVNDEFPLPSADFPGVIDTYQEELNGDDNEVFVDVACFPDCNFNVIDDTIELAAGSALDCNTNAIPDVCDIDANPGSDCNTNGVPDECEPDCNGDGIPDGCDSDCDASGVSDACEIAAGSSIDCNENRIPDHCDIGDLISPDCDSNGIPDDCQPDCNNNGVADACDIMSGTSEDCVSTNGAGGAVTGESDGIPDECEPAFPIDLITSTWVTTSGLWSVPRSWCPMIVPNNSGTSDFAVQFKGATAVATLDISTALRQLDLSDQAVIQVDEVSPFLASLAVEDASSNGGTLQALNTTTNGDAGRILQLTIADLQQNSNGQLVADGPGTIVRLVESVVTGGSIQTRNGGVVELTGGSELVNVQINGVVVPDGQVGFFSGLLTNSGILSVAPDGRTSAELIPDTDGGILAGDGGADDCVRLGGQSVARLGNFKSSFCNASNHLIDGAGILYGGMENDGFVKANSVAGSDQNNLIIFPPGAKTNAGTMMASNGAVLRIESPIDQASTGVIEAVTGGEVRILAPITGGGLVRVHDPCGTGILGCSTPILRIASFVEADELLALEGGVIEVVGDADLNLIGEARIIGGIYRGDPAESGSLTAGLTTTSVHLTSDGDLPGEMQISGNMRLTSTGAVRITPCENALHRNSQRGCSIPILHSIFVIEHDAEVLIGGDFAIETAVMLTVTSSQPVRLLGNLDNQSTEPAIFDWLNGHLLLDGIATQEIEAAGENRGDTPAGFVDNFAIGTLELESGVTAMIVNEADNVTTSGPGCDEALYVDTLILAPGATLDADTCGVFYKNLTNNGGTIINHGTAVRNVPSYDYDNDGDIDLDDYRMFASCLDNRVIKQTCLDRFDVDHDLLLTLFDFSAFQIAFRNDSDRDELRQ